MHLRTLIGLVALLLSAGCGSDYPDPHDRVIHYGEGQRESDLLREVGPPSRAQSVRDSGEHSACRGGTFGAQADRELRYDIPSRGFEKRARQILRLGPAQTRIVCVDVQGNIMRVVIEEVH